MRIGFHLLSLLALLIGSSGVVCASLPTTSFSMTASLQTSSPSTLGREQGASAKLTSVVESDKRNEQQNDQSKNQNSAQQIVVLAINGNISRKLVDSVRLAVEKVNGDPIPAGLIVLLDSSGGDGMAAMKIGRILRPAHAHIFVTGQCASACILVLASGVVRSAPAYSVGIHRGRITISDSNAKVLQEVDVNTNPSAKKTLEKFEQEVPVYFSDMGMPPDLFQAMQSHQYKGVYRLTSEENTFYGLTGFDSAYLADRAALFEEMKGAYHMDKNELHRRTLKVASHCAEFDKQYTAFINCYKKVLKDPYLN